MRMYKLFTVKFFEFLAVLVILQIPAESFAQSRKIHFSGDGFLKVDGKRQFIIGTYHLPHDETPCQTLARHGFNLVRTPLEQDALDNAQQYNLFAWSSVGHLKSSAAPEKVEAFRKKIRRWKSHPALLFWVFEDDPAFTWRSVIARVTPEPLIHPYKVVEQEDPDH
ncbi:MAG: hypothetical protein DWQ10_10795, partial [Calditrichaeota bacterium]